MAGEVGSDGVSAAGHEEEHWDLTPREAAARQLEIKREVVRENWLGTVALVAGADVHLRLPRPAAAAGEETPLCLAAAAGEEASPRGGGPWAARRHKTVEACAVVVVLSYPRLDLLEVAEAVVETSFPYVPGLLSFREAPALLAALARLSARPDLLLCDGQGVAHPRRAGLASHLGVLTGIPTIGVAKSRLTGRHEEPGWERGSVAPLMEGEEQIGAVVRTRSGVKPLYVSVGHLVDLPAAVDWTLRCTTRYRLPETNRLAHQAASRLAKST